VAAVLLAATVFVVLGTPGRPRGAAEGPDGGDGAEAGSVTRTGASA